MEQTYNITLNKKDKDTLIVALTNATILYNDLIGSIRLGLGPQINTNKYEILNNVDGDFLKEQINILTDLYKKITGVK